MYYRRREYKPDYGRMYPRKYYRCYREDNERYEEDKYEYDRYEKDYDYEYEYEYDRYEKDYRNDNSSCTCNKQCNCGNSIGCNCAQNYKRSRNRKPIFDTRCDCCVEPMNYVLCQLQGLEVTVETTANDGAVTGVVQSVCNSVLDLAPTGSTGTNYLIPVSQIVWVQNTSLKNVTLLPPCKNRTGECNCLECGTRKSLENLEGIQNVDFNFIGGADLDGTRIIRVGEGVAIVQVGDGNDIRAISICNIARVDVG